MARPKSEGETKTHQQHLLMAPSEVQAIDDWGFSNRIRSRGEAIRRLCQMGLAMEAAAPEMVKHMNALANSSVAVTKAFDAWENDTNGEIDGDAIFVSVADTMRNATKLLFTAAEAGERQEAWKRDYDFETVAKDAARLESRLKLRRDTSGMDDE